MYDDISDGCCDTGSVKKVVSTLKIIHDRSKCNDSSVEEFQSAVSHTRESRATNNMDTHILNPFQALSLFKRMLDEVDIFIHVDFFCFSGLVFLLLPF